MNWQQAIGNQMPIRFQRISDIIRYIGNRQIATRCQFAHFCELATGNWQPAGNSISEYLKRLKLNRTLANSEKCQFTISLELATSNWQPDANSILEDFI